MTNLGKNTEDSRRVLNILEEGGAGQQLPRLVLKGSWGAAQILVGW